MQSRFNKLFSLSFCATFRWIYTHWGLKCRDFLCYKCYNQKQMNCAVLSFSHPCKTWYWEGFAGLNQQSCSVRPQMGNKGYPLSSGLSGFIHKILP